MRWKNTSIHKCHYFVCGSVCYKGHKVLLWANLLRAGCHCVLKNSWRPVRLKTWVKLEVCVQPLPCPPQSPGLWLWVSLPAVGICHCISLLENITCASPPPCTVAEISWKLMGLGWMRGGRLCTCLYMNLRLTCPWWNACMIAIYIWTLLPLCSVRRNQHFWCMMHVSPFHVISLDEAYCQIAVF